MRCSWIMIIVACLIGCSEAQTRMQPDELFQECCRANRDIPPQFHNLCNYNGNFEDSGRLSVTAIKLLIFGGYLKSVQPYMWCAGAELDSRDLCRRYKVKESCLSFCFAPTGTRLTTDVANIHCIYELPKMRTAVYYNVKQMLKNKNQ